MTAPSSDETLGELLARVQSGEAHAFSVLYARTSPQLFAVLKRMLRRQDLAEEALQDVFVNIWSKAGSYRPARGPAMAWLVSMARYRAIDLKRRGYREMALEDAPLAAQAEVADTTPGPMAEALWGLDRQRLEDCLTELSDGQQRGIRLAYLDGLTQEEVATHLNSPLGTVKSWIRRGLQALKECLGR